MSKPKSRKKPTVQPKRRKAGERNAVDEEASLSEISADLDRLVESRIAICAKLAGELRKVIGGRRRDVAAHENRRRMLQMRLSLAEFDAHLAGNLRRAVVAIVSDAADKVAQIEREARIAIQAALADHHAASALTQSLAPPKLRGARPTVGPLLERVKQAAAVVIADRDRLIESLEAMPQTPERANTIAQLRHDLRSHAVMAERLLRRIRAVEAHFAVRT